MNLRWYWWVIGLIVLGFGIAWYATDILPERAVRESGGRDGAVATNSTDTSTSGSSVASDCPEPLVLTAPVDVSLATSVLYPGQSRGGDYKPHGGFRFADGTNNQITVTAPLDAKLVRASRYLEQGETQYLFEFESECGVSYRFDHLLTLASKFAAAAETLPATQPDDSRTTNLNPPVSVSAGEEIATAVGFAQTGNTAVDFGVYDFRTPNTASQDPAWASEHADDRELAAHALCWFNLLPASDVTTVKSLPPADSQSGSTSDYCQ